MTVFRSIANYFRGKDGAVVTFSLASAMRQTTVSALCDANKAEAKYAYLCLGYSMYANVSVTCYYPAVMSIHP